MPVRGRCGGWSLVQCRVGWWRRRGDDESARRRVGVGVAGCGVRAHGRAPRAGGDGTGVALVVIWSVDEWLGGKRGVLRVRVGRDGNLALLAAAALNDESDDSGEEQDGDHGADGDADDDARGEG